MSGPSALAGRHAVITGASRGIGAAIASALAAEGMRLSLLGRDAAALAQVVEACGPDTAHGIVADVSDQTAVARAMDEARARFGPVHVLVNNAGQAASAKFTETGPELWNRILGVNLTGTYLCTRAVVADMLQGGYGRIVNIASIAGLRGGAYLSAYVTSKHAVVGLTRALALEYATRGITVNAVCPGYVDTDIVKNAIANIARKTGRSAEEALATLVATNPQGRLVTCEEVAAAVLYLCRPGSDSVTGQSLVLAGGEVT
ncbi:MAG: SDR family oxidoreductase [Proteobacteria bacterium]|nr:SDR family oxidoreductase [Pseudomonadota bacterium]